MEEEDVGAAGESLVEVVVEGSIHGDDRIVDANQSYQEEEEKP